MTIQTLSNLGGKSSFQSQVTTVKQWLMKTQYLSICGCGVLRTWLEESFLSSTPGIQHTQQQPDKYNIFYLSQINCCFEALKKGLTPKIRSLKKKKYIYSSLSSSCLYCHIRLASFLTIDAFGSYLRTLAVILVSVISWNQRDGRVKVLHRGGLCSHYACRASQQMEGKGSIKLSETNLSLQLWSALLQVQQNWIGFNRGQLSDECACMIH